MAKTQMKKIVIYWPVFQDLVTDMGYRAKELKSGEVSLYGKKGPIKFFPQWKQPRKVK